MSRTIGSDPASPHIAAESPQLAENAAGPSAGPDRAAGAGVDLERSASTAVRRQAILLSVGCAAAALLCLVLAAADRATTAAWRARATRATSIAADAAAIAGLRALPQQATEAGLPRADLLDRVSRAMQTAGLSAECLVSTLPQPPRKPPGASHAEVVHRLMLENVALEPLARFCFALTDEDAALRISAVQLRAASDRKLWSADVSVSYWIVAPEPKR